MNKFDGNVRTTKVLSDDELRASLKGGWDEELPAIKDEHGVLIVGHRRMKIAKEEGIKPVVKVVIFEDGPKGEAARRRLANVSNIGGAPMTPEDRKHQVEQMYKTMTQTQIAHVLGVSQSTIRDDLANLVGTTKLKHSKTTSNPKGAGRPKSQPKTPKPVPLKETDAARGRIAGIDIKVGPDIWKRFNEKAREEKKSATIKVAELVEADVDPEVDVKSLPMSAQEKVAAAIRQEKKKLAIEFSQRVQDEVRKRIDEMVLPRWKEQIEQAKTLYERRRGAMNKETFNAIRRALHPDSRNAISDKKLGEAFDTFMRLEKYLLNEKDSPTDWSPGLPSSLAEWDKMRATKRKRPSGPTEMRRR